jgi:spectinomycin phosphotransferase
LLNPRALTSDLIHSALRAIYSLQASHVILLPGGADLQSAVYRVETGDAAYVLKIRRTAIDPITLEAPAYLHAHGIAEVMSALPTAEGRLWANAHDVVWILYPFFASADAYGVSLTTRQWITLGRTLNAVRSSQPLPELRQRLRSEDYSARWRAIVRDFTAQLDTRVDADPLAQALTVFWEQKRSEIGAIVERAEQLGSVLLARPAAFVLCHADLHPGNVLLGSEDTLRIIDWDEVMLAPKERDLMMLDGGVSPRWNDPEQDALFFAGYGATELDLVALSYYTYERIIADLATFGMQIWDGEGSADERALALRMVQGNFLPGEVVEMAHRRFERIAPAFLSSIG